MTFKEFGVSRGLIFRTTLDPSGMQVFNFTTNEYGDIVTVSDPIMLAELLIEGSEHDTNNIVKMILESSTTERLMLDKNLVLWSFRYHGTKFKTWLIEQLTKANRADLIEKISVM